MADSEQHPTPAYDNPKTAALLIVLHSWQTLLSTNASLSRQYLKDLASAHDTTFTDPSDLKQCRQELVAALSEEEEDLTIDRLQSVERQHFFISRLNSLWNVAWMNGVPALIVVPWAVQRLPDAFARQGIMVGVMVSTFAVFAFLLIAYLSLFAQHLLSAPYCSLVNRIVGVNKTG